MSEALEQEIGIDLALLKSEIQKTYSAVSQKPDQNFIFPTGRSWAEDLDYPPELNDVPDSAVESFAGVANPFSLGRLAPGERVLDLGCGAGTDSLVAAQMVGESGSVVGIDMTPAMLMKARRAAAELGASNVEFVEGEVESLPFADESFDVVISNGVIDLIPDKDAVYSEIQRVLAPGGRLQIADVTIQNPVSAEGRRNIDLWTGWIAGALLEGAYATLMKRHGFERIETGLLVDTYARSKFEDTRRKAQKFGARGTTLKAFKPSSWSSVHRRDEAGVEVAAIDQLVALKGRRVLDVGCGEGRLTAFAAARGAIVYAFDPSDENLRAADASLTAEQRSRVRFAARTAEALDVPRERFDVALCGWSLWCVPVEGVVDALRNIHSALIPYGLVVDTQPVGAQPWVAVDGVEVGRLDMFEWMSTIAAVDSVVEATVDDGLFEMFHEARLIVADSFENGAECLETIADWRDTHVPPALLNRLEAEQTVVTVEQDVRLRLLRSR